MGYLFASLCDVDVEDKEYRRASSCSKGHRMVFIFDWLYGIIATDQFLNFNTEGSLKLIMKN